MLEYNKSSIASRIITKSAKGNLTIFAFDEGQKLNEQVDPFDATVQILEGSGKIIINEKVHTVNEGECLIMPANIPHAIEAKQRFKMLMTMMKS